MPHSTLSSFAQQHLGECILNPTQIAQGVSRVATMLNAQFDDAVIISVVPGGVIFTADLVRQLDFDVAMDVISCPHTPGERNNASVIDYRQTVAIYDRDVIVVDDAIESGGTMKRLIEHLAQFEPRSLSIATLFVKPGRVAIDVPQYYALEMVNDDLLVGYGLPWEHKLRNLPAIYQLKQGK
ncbi:hypoxanthine phosphoribosyltransferase [Vibrio sp. SM6]|uniref:Hypoxanthine phosphoribosyltransferase n=1 Tax=Vibrio agarilyticus TaxID=2726741 RepID=A0A7X8YFY0_9VIBR|nr:phosphoribosyltransferase family protein [Vibrio agarilyticus]NLS12010.1 hypoxanthine phosphoribosyltransferase [Vibrio agarilyticus]